MTSRSPAQCRQRWAGLCNPNKEKRAWSTAENKRLHELASKLEREKLIEEKRTVKEINTRIEKDKRDMIESFSKFWDDQIKMTKERIEVEKQNRKCKYL